MPPKPPRRAGAAAARNQRSSPDSGSAPLPPPPVAPRLEIGEADFVVLCDSLKVSGSVREKAWRTYESLAAAEGALLENIKAFLPDSQNLITLLQQKRYLKSLNPNAGSRSVTGNQFCWCVV